jgi:hypothetical protein
MANAPLRLASFAADGWIVLAAGRLLTVTCVAQVRGVKNQLVLAVVVRNDEARRREGRHSYADSY